MKFFFENVDLNSTSGPNSFARKLVKYMYQRKHTMTNKLDEADAHLCFIESRMQNKNVPLFQRLDGIYFNSSQDFKGQNSSIEKTYNRSKGVVFQTNFNKELTFRYFGDHPNTKVIHNGADLDLISTIKPLAHTKIKNCENLCKPYSYS